MASQSSTSSFEPIIDSKSIEEAIEDEELSFVMAEDDASDKIPDEMSKSKYSQVITLRKCRNFLCQSNGSLEWKAGKWFEVFIYFDIFI